MTKRIFDIIVSIIGLIFFSPVIAITAFFVLLNYGLPVLFKQIRAGYQGVPFVMYKFRSMTNSLDESGNPLVDQHRLTKFGSLIRSFSLDELPALWNVFIGNMSLVGPRPLLVEYLPLYDAKQALRHNVKPGITGWAQVNGRNAISWQEKFELDVWYVHNHSIFLDLKILLMTVKKVLFREDIAESGQVTMSKFTGNSE